MFFQQSYLQGLGHASYLVGSQQNGEALVFDPDATVPNVPGDVLSTQIAGPGSVKRIHFASLVRRGA